MDDDFGNFAVQPERHVLSRKKDKKSLIWLHIVSWPREREGVNFWGYKNLHDCILINGKLFLNREICTSLKNVLYSPDNINQFFFSCVVKYNGTVIINNDIVERTCMYFMDGKISQFVWILLHVIHTPCYFNFWGKLSFIKSSRSQAQSQRRRRFLWLTMFAQPRFYVIHPSRWIIPRIYFHLIFSAAEWMHTHHYFSAGEYFNNW